MKNLKRVLSLALTGVMLTGMMTIGASAANKDFTDADEIQHTEAVNVMSTLGVLKGKDTGAFDPNTTVTRAEMAKIICVMLNGGNDPTLGSGSNAMFSDINGHWAKNYIEYCASMKIIAGMGDGTFGPDLPVTGAAAAKMLLVAMGYDSEIFNFTGADWEINVNRQANEAKLYEEIKSIDTSAGLSRDNTAQMAYNALEAKVMTTGYDKVVSTGEISYNYGLSNETFLNKYFQANTWIGLMDGNSNNLGITDGHIQVSGKLDTAEEKVEPKPANFPSDFDISYIGEEVKVIFKDGKSGTKGQPDKNDTIFGVFVTGATEVINTTTAKIDDLKTTETKVKVDGTKYDLADKVIVVKNYVGTGTEYKEDSLKGTKDTKNSALTTALQDTKNGDTLKLILKDGKVERAYIVNSRLAVVTSKNSTKISVNDNKVGTITVADHEVYEDIAVDDVVVISVLYADKANDDKGLAIVEKAEVVKGEIDSFEDMKNVKLDDTTYKIYKPDGSEMFTSDIDDAQTTFKSEHVGEEFELYLVNGYVGAAVQVSESASNYSVVTEVKGGATAGSTFNALELAVMDGEGNKSIITVSDDSYGKKDTEGDKKAGVSAADYKVGMIVTYTTNKDKEAVVKLAQTKSGTGSKDDKGYEKTTKSFNGVVTTSNCVLFANTSADGTKIKAYNIRDLRDITLKGKAYNVVEKDGKIVAVYIDNGETPKGATSAKVYGIVSTNGRTTKVNGDPYKQFTVSSNGTDYTINVPTSNSTIARDAIVWFEPTSDNTYNDEDIHVIDKDTTKADNNDVVLGYVESWESKDGLLTVAHDLTKDEDGGRWEVNEAAGRGTYATDNDTKIYYVDVENHTGVESGSITKFDSITGYNNVLVVVDDKTAVAIIVEVGGGKNLIKVD